MAALCSGSDHDFVCTCRYQVLGSFRLPSSVIPVPNNFEVNLQRQRHTFLFNFITAGLLIHITIFLSAIIQIVNASTPIVLKSS